jgi:hypothetical protein
MSNNGTMDNVSRENKLKIKKKAERESSRERDDGSCAAHGWT